MNYEQFICAMLDCTNNNLQEQEIAERQEVLKNNGVVMIGLTIKKTGNIISPVIYLEEYYKKYLAGASVEELSEDLIERSRQTPETLRWDSSQLFDFEQIKDKIIYRLINTEENVKMLSEVPNLPMFDLSIVFYLQISISENENGSILIRNAHLKLWNCSISMLYQLARENTPGICKPVLCRLADFLNANEMYMEEECPILILSNETGINGAAALLYPKMPEHIYEAVGGNYYLLPSSVHEFLIVPEEEEVVPARLTEIVKEVNRTEIAKEEFLSDEIYYFDGDIITKM